MPKTNFSQTPNFPELEQEIIKFWREDQTFNKSVEQRSKDNSYTFYDGPPFATGTPHYGHILASTMKDVVPRYWTMKGKRVERRWGWDCHGLPIENIAEKEMGITRKKQIIELGVDKFNEICRSKVLGYVDDWKVLIERIGRWADMENAYKTMDKDFMESVWWVFKELYDRDLIYQSHRVMHICPRCETTLSQSEVAEGYKEVTDISVVAEFKVLNPEQLLETTDQIFVLAWTTTPWTLPGNLLLAVNPELKYVLFRATEAGKLYLAAQERMEFVMGDGQYEVVKTFTGQELSGLTYQPLFPYFANTDKAFQVKAAEFVSAVEGTGIVHIAPGFGQDDYLLGKREGLPVLQHVSLDGRFTKQVTDFALQEVKPKDNPQATDIEIIKYLAAKDLLWSKQKIHHQYPHCWRCDTPLLNYATSSWFVAVEKIKDELLAQAENINWVPNHLKDGRFGNWLKGARDWSISRQRFWASVIPIWQCECGELKVIGSVAELEQLSGQKVNDLHKHVIDPITFPCPKCQQTMKRIPDVLDTWFDSGSMPYAQAHLPFENQEWFEQNFPAEFIAEGVDQTRAWFYYLHVIATGIRKSNAFKNVVVNGIVLAEDGKKMSKRLKNYPDPQVIIDHYGADSLRWYLCNSPVLKAENLNFSEKEVAETRRKVFVMYWNMLAFYQQFSTDPTMVSAPTTVPVDVLDQWLLSRIQSVISETTNLMDSYDLVKSSRLLTEFIDQLSTWYLRLSRDRLRTADKTANQVFGYALYTLAQLMAPFAPFFSEVVHQSLVAENTSIHLTNWPAANQTFENKNLETEMAQILEIVSLGNAARRAKAMKVRQPLAKLEISGNYQLSKINLDKLTELIKQELNVKVVTWTLSESPLTVNFDFELTEELKAEGEAREIVRAIQDLRKKSGLMAHQHIAVTLPSWPIAWEDYIKQKSNVDKLISGDELKISES